MSNKCSRLTDNGSRITAHGSRITAHGSRITAHAVGVHLDSMGTSVVEVCYTIVGGYWVSEAGSSTEYEIGVSFRYAQEHGWVVQAITGFLSAYYMEDIRFRVKRHVHELETGMNVWITEAPSEKFIVRLLKRLQQDVPPFQFQRREITDHGTVRHVIDLPNEPEK